FRTGVPVTTEFPWRYRADSGYAVATTRATRESSLVVRPGNAFCSCNTIGTRNAAAARTIGALTQPPVPSTTSGLNSRTIRTDWRSAQEPTNGTDHFRQDCAMASLAATALPTPRPERA